MKKVLYLDPEMERTHEVPDNDPEGKLFNEYLHLCYDYQFADPDEPQQREVALKAISEFHRTHPFKEVALIKKQHILLGRGAAMRGYGKFSNKTSYPGINPGESDYTKALKPPSQSETMPLISYVTHPDNIKAMTQEWLDHFDIRPLKTHAEYMKEWRMK